MTAEVVALNKSAAAMAADSKGTVRVNGFIKTHDTLNKLFTLSKYQPVGVMIYGNAEIMGTPWETVIKVYREKLRHRCFAKLNRYGHDFVSCIVNDYEFSDERQEENVFWLAHDFISRLAKAGQELVEEDENVAPRDALEAAIEQVRKETESTRVFQDLKNIAADDIKEMYGESIRAAFQEVI